MPFPAARHRIHKIVRATTQRAGAAFHHIGDRVSGVAFINETHNLPRPVRVGEALIDVVDDLAAFTRLDRALVERELRHRRSINFRNEWFATPRELRVDDWFYLSSKAYLFANATHFADGAFVRDFVQRYVPKGAQVLEFGGGTGELALQLAGAGIKTTYIELNALQQEFVRFRLDRHDLLDMIDVLAHWAPIGRGAFDAVLALDVLEHLPDARSVLLDRLLPALRPSGVLIENSPFEVGNAANPMHHGDFGFERFMHDQSFEMVGTPSGGARAWRR